MYKVLWAAIILLLGGMMAGGGCRPADRAVLYKVYSQPQLWAIPKDDPVYAVITESNWQMYYNSIPPEADFSNHVYVVASWGARPNAGFRISITGITQSGYTVRVHLKLEMPDPARAYAEVITHPTAVAQIDSKSLRPGGALSFEFVDQIGNKVGAAQANT